MPVPVGRKVTAAVRRKEYRSFRRRFRLPYPVFQHLVGLVKERGWFPSPSRDVAGRNCVPVELKVSLWLLPSQMLAQGVVGFFARSVYYVHATEETYTATQQNLAKLAKEPLATYQIRLWSQRGTKVNRPHHGDTLLHSPLWFGIETKNQLVICNNPATS